MSESSEPTVALAVIASGDRLLLVSRRAPDGAPPWVMPGGKTEPGESPEQAAVREAREETGLEVAARRVLGNRVHPVTGSRVTYVACDVISGTASVTSPGEVNAVQWVPLSALTAYLPGGLYAPVQRYLNSLPHA